MAPVGPADLAATDLALPAGAGPRTEGDERFAGRTLDRPRLHRAIVLDRLLTTGQYAVHGDTQVERAHDRFELSPEDHYAIETRAREDELEVVGVWHTHPDQPARPSLTDREAAWEGYAYVILSTSPSGVHDVRSWRLIDDAFREETILEQPS